jgi:hypothetical protein
MARKRLRVFASVLVALCASPRTEAANRAEEIARRAEPCLRWLLERSAYGVAELEEAAWLVEMPGAGGPAMSCLLWPSTWTPGEARWPAGRPISGRLVGQVHTHATRAASGRSWGAGPSARDCATARRLKLPVLVVSPVGISVCEPDERARRLFDSSWTRWPIVPVTATADRLTWASPGAPAAPGDAVATR